MVLTFLMVPAAADKFAVVGTIEVPDEPEFHSAVIDTTQGFAYFVGNSVLKISLSDFTLVGKIQLPFTPVGTYIGRGSVLDAKNVLSSSQVTPAASLP